MLADDHGLGQTLGPRRLHVVLADDLQHALPHVARQPGQSSEGDHGHGQDQVGEEVDLLPPEGHVLVVQGAQPGDGEPVELHAEEDHKEKGQPEIRGGEADEDEDGGDLVEERVLARGRGDADGNGEGHDDDHLNEVEEEGDGQPLADLGEYGLGVGLKGAAEVEPADADEPAPVLDVDGLVEPVFLVQPLDELGVLPRLLTADVVEGPPGGQLDNQERNEGDPDEERDRQHQPAQREKRHLAGRIALQCLRHEPIDEVVADPRRRRHDSAHAGGHRGERIIEVEEDEGLVLGENLLDPVVGGHALLLVAAGAALLEERVHLGVRIGDLVELIGAHLR